MVQLSHPYMTVGKTIALTIQIFVGKASLVAQMAKNVCNAGYLSLIPVSGRSSGEGNDNLFQYSCLENPHGPRSLGGYNQWDRKESDTTERLNTARTLASFFLEITEDS